MRNLKSILSAIAMMALVCSCSSDSDNPVPNPTPTPPAEAFKGVIFATSITNPEGNNGSGYMQALPDMLSGTYDNSNGVPVGFGVSPIPVESGSVYVLPDYMGNAKAEIVRYGIDAAGKWEKKGVLPIPAGAAACNIVELNSEKAYVSLQGLGIVMAFNPATMARLADIDLNSLRQEDTRVAPAAMIIRNGKLFVGLNQMNAQYMPARNNIELAVIDTKTDKVEKHIVNTTLGLCFATRPISPRSIFMDENRDIYINCIGSFGFIPEFHGGIVRIKNGSTDIDPGYSIRCDQTEVSGLPAKYADFFGEVCYGGNGQLYAYANCYLLDPKGMENPYLSLTNIPVVIDLKQKSISVIKGMEISNPQGIAIGRYKNLMVFGSANKKANGFYTYNPATKEVAGPVMQVKGNPTFFHSFAK
ncbi:hypothetical protein [Prevotella dentasini]|uniref:hypothetical protein n=1 Tax=Prevotella dentasini TaxID=589537 RepID=UPI0004681216|nr:hypothetical protein [Prevotella dentasini]